MTTTTQLNKAELAALKDVHETNQHNCPLLLPRKKYGKAFKSLEMMGLIDALKFNTYSIRLTANGMEKCIELMKNGTLVSEI